MQANLCKTCGGDLHRVGNHYICQACGNRWSVDAADDVHVVDRANAWAALRDGNFDHAAELFEIIHEKEPKDHEAFWGLALACAGILYVIDYEEHKKVPTCNNIGEDSFIGSKNVKKAIELAPPDIAAGYRQQAEQIEKIRLEWMQKARKEPPYDVFLSYKDSDREHGIDRTQDSVDAQDLYNMLTAEGYKVFFSRISLRDKVSEHYEPYIYNAIKTAKVMIVFGEKAEYFSSTWIKNEWSRFKKRVEEGEKHPNSLIVVCKNMNPGDLPVVLRSRQCLNAGDITFSNDLLRHIDKVVSASKGNEHLEKIKVSGGHIGKKASTIAQNSISKREIGQNAAAKTSIDEKQSLMLVESYIKEKQWEEADTLLENVLFNNPSFAEAIWCKLLINQQVTSNATLVRILDRFKPEDYALIEKALNCASVEFAGRILDLLYQSCRILSNQVREKLYNLILPYRYERRSQRLKENFEWCIANRDFKLFKLLLSALESEDVDDYIRYNCQYMKSTLDHQEKRECTDNILAVDEGNRDARMYIFESELATATKITTVSESFENVLKYSANIDADVEDAIVMVAGVLSTPLHCEFAQQLPKYYTGDLRTIRRPLLMMANRLIEKSFFKEAEYFFNLLLAVNESDAEAFWGICMAKTHSSSEEQIINSAILLSEQAEYNKYLSLVSEERRVQCMRLAKKQQTTQKSIKRKKIRIAIGVSVAAVVIAGVTATFTYILPSVQLKQANELFAAGNYSEANELYQKLGGFGNSGTRSETVKAILQVQAGNHATAVETLLAAGVPVEITYRTEGGSLEGTDALMLGHTLSLDGSIIPLAAGENGGTVSETTRTFHDSASFTGLLTPARDGYRFAHWETQTFIYDATGQDPVFHLTLKAVWNPQEYVINYHLDGGTVAGVNPVEYGVEDADITLIEPTRAGYEFLGWTGNDLAEPTRNVTIPTGSHGDRVYTAVWKAKEFKLTLDVKGGTCSETEVTVTFGQEFTLPVPEKVGYAFGGWYDTATQTLFSAGTCNLSSDAALYAHWKLVDYTITYNLNGGTNPETNPDTYTYNQEVVLSAPAKVGYTFLGWTFDGQTEPVKEVTIALNSTGDKVYTANWSKDALTVTFDPNGGTIEEASLPVSYGDAWTLPVPLWDGHSFNGWYLEGTRIEDGVCTLTKSCTLVAKWDAVSYNITYQLDGGVNHADNPANYTCNDEIVLAAPTKEGYTFLGWSFEGQTEPMMSVTIPKNTTGYKEFTANWRAISSTVTLDAAGGTCDEDELTVTYGKVMNLPVPLWEGHTFGGWFRGEERVENGTCRLTADAALVAHWDSIEYTITYNLGGGTLSEKNPASYVYEDSITLNVPSREGYEFLGWLYNGQTEPVLNVAFSGEIGNKEFTAVWKDTAFTVTLEGVRESKTELTVTYRHNFDGGETDSVTYRNGDTLTYKFPPAREGYVFAGWYANAACEGTPYDLSAQLNEDIDLYAKWIRTHALCVGTINMNGSEEGIEFTDIVSEPCYAFVSPVAQQVTISATHTGDDPYLALHDANMSALSSYDYSYGEGEASITVTVEANTVYYISYASYSAGTGALYLTGDLPDGGIVAVDGEEGWYYDEAGEGDWDVVLGEIPNLPTPTRPGYTFTGWYAGATRVDPSAPWSIEEDTVLTAHWEVQTYTITLDANGGTFTGENGDPVETLTVEVVYGDDYNFSAPQKDGMSFLCWYCYDLDSTIAPSGIWEWLPTHGGLTFEVEAEWRTAASS